MYYWVFSSKEPVLYVVYAYIMTMNVFELKKKIKNWIVCLPLVVAETWDNIN